MGTPVWVELEREGTGREALRKDREYQRMQASPTSVYRLTSELNELALAAGLVSLDTFFSSSEELQREFLEDLRLGTEQSLALGVDPVLTLEDIEKIEIEPELWFMPEDGLAATRALLQHIWREYPIVEHVFWNVEFLEGLVLLFEAATRYGVRFHLDK